MSTRWRRAAGLAADSRHGDPDRARARRLRGAAAGRALAAHGLNRRRSPRARRACIEPRPRVGRKVFLLRAASTFGTICRSLRLAGPDPSHRACPVPRRALAPLMTKSLIIAEKPSVAADIARALGGFTRHDDYFESDRLRALVGGRPSARDRHARGRGGQARQVDVRAPAGDPAALRSEADREEREPAEAAAEAHQAQGRRRRSSTPATPAAKAS